MISMKKPLGRCGELATMLANAAAVDDVALDASRGGAVPSLPLPRQFIARSVMTRILPTHLAWKLPS
jgi:hypothetical protein